MKIATLHGTIAIFNISFGESMELIAKTNMNYKDFTNLIKHLPRMSWGDIYVFSK